VGSPRTIPAQAADAVRARAALLKGEHKYELEFAGSARAEPAFVNRGSGAALPSPNPSSASQMTIGNSDAGDGGRERDGWLPR
jgi:hypothetical protein